jgi:hypothetical protein
VSPPAAPVQRRTLLPLPPESEKLVNSGVAVSSSQPAAERPQTVQDSVANPIPIQIDQIFNCTGLLRLKFCWQLKFFLKMSTGTGKL